MKPIIATERMDICLAQDGDIHQIMVLEEDEENRRFIWQGSYEEHLREIESEDTYLLTLKKKSCEGLLGFALCSLDKRSDSFELRRIAVSEKGRGYGREAIRGIIDYCFNSLESNRLWLDVYPHNEVGIHLYRSLGMTLEGRLRQSYRGADGYLDQFIFSILREEYRKEKIKKSLK